jgi:hypothetical protein
MSTSPSKRTKKGHSVDNNNTNINDITSTDNASTDNNDIGDILPALSPYNFFFRDERERLLEQTLHHCTAEAVDEIARASLPPDYYCSERAKLFLLQKHWYRDRTVRRRHRKTHQRIGFSTWVAQNFGGIFLYFYSPCLLIGILCCLVQINTLNDHRLSKVIGQRWRGLSDDGKEFYRDVAGRDAARYAREVAEQQQQQNTGKGELLQNITASGVQAKTSAYVVITG